jgi:hypothetical protein
MRILQITYYYPPMGGAGVQRALKFSKYLPEFGIEPVVLAAENKDYISDRSLLKELPESLRIVRVQHRPLLGILLKKVRSRIKSTKSHVNSVKSEVTFKKPNARWRDIILGIYTSLQIPDDKSVWARRAFKPACELVYSERIDLIFVTVPSYSALNLAARVSAETGCPWVADYRDLWVNNPDYSAPFWRKPIDHWLEKRWLKSASGIVAVTPSMQRSLIDVVRPGCPVAMIPNGYDEADFFNKSQIHENEGVVRIVHVGTFYGQRSPDIFLKGVSKYLETNDKSSKKLKIKFVGNVGSRFSSSLQIFNNKWPNILEYNGFVHHDEAVAEILAADLLLLVIGGGVEARGVLTGKIFEYIRANRPILLLGPCDGDAANLLRQHASFLFASPDDPDAIANTLKDFMGEVQLSPRPANANPAMFERRELARELAKFLRSCMELHHE